jgi:hypothetical protein
MSSGSKPAGTQITTTDTSPWSAQQPFLKTGFQRAEDDVLNAPAEYYPNSTVVPFSGQTTNALDLQEQRALGGDPTVQAGQTQVQDTLQGDYLNSNPHLNQAIQNATAPIAESFNEDIIPGIQSGFSGSGRYGSGLQARAQERAGIAAGDQMGKIATDMLSQAYDAERQRQMQAATMAPTYGQQSYTDIANLANVGQVRENQAGAELQEDINRFQQGQQAPKDALAQYMALVGGGSYGGSTTGTSPIYRDKASDMLGGASTAAGIAGTLFGKGGVWPS